MLASFARQCSSTSTSAVCRQYCDGAVACIHTTRCRPASLDATRSRTAAAWPQGFPLVHLLEKEWKQSSDIQDLQDLSWQACPVLLPCADNQSYDYDVLGIGQGMVDFAASVDDEKLQCCNVAKGGRRVISVEERADVIELLSGVPSRLSAGGSLANTLVGLARLGAADCTLPALASSNSCSTSSSSNINGRSSRQSRQRRPRVAIGGAIGGDALGNYFTAQLAAAGVTCVDPPAPGSQTGTVMVLSTPDAQRSFLSYFSQDAWAVSAQLEAAVQRSRLVVIEGYMFELPGAETALPALVRTAKEGGATVALTAGDAGVVARHREAMLAALDSGVDVLFTNAAEAAQLLGVDGSSRLSNNSSSNSVSASQEVAAALGTLCADTVALVVVTDGSCGSYICSRGQLLTVPPAWCPAPPVDTCGAGDAYAAGLLHGLLLGLSLPAMGLAAARTASAVIGRLSPHLQEQDAEAIAAGLLPARLGGWKAVAGSNGTVLRPPAAMLSGVDAVSGSAQC